MKKACQYQKLLLRNGSDAMRAEICEEKHTACLLMLDLSTGSRDIGARETR